MKTMIRFLASVCLLFAPHVLRAQDDAPIESIDPEPVNHSDDPETINTNAKEPMDNEPLEAPVDNGGAAEFSE